MSVFTQDLRFGFFDVPLGRRLTAMKEAGFDEIMFVWEDVSPVGVDARHVYDAAKAVGLNVTVVHYPQQKAALLWTEGEDGERYTEDVITALGETGERGIKSLVMHTTRALITPPPCTIGAERFGRILDAAEEYGVQVALENTRFLAYNRYLAEACPSPMLGFCFDSGHANCFTPGEDPLGLFGDRLTAMHLHDNDGRADQHMRPGLGCIKWEPLMRRLKALNPRSWNLESVYSEKDREMGLSMEAYLSLSAEWLREMTRSVM